MFTQYTAIHVLHKQVKSFMDIGANDTTVDELIQYLDDVYSSYILHNDTAKLTVAIPSDLEGAKGFFMKNFQSIVKVRLII